VPREQSGIWEGFIGPASSTGRSTSTTSIRASRTGADKADPFAVYAEQPPRPGLDRLGPDSTGAMPLDVKSLSRHSRSRRGRSTRFTGLVGCAVPEENRWLTYRELAPRLAELRHRLGPSPPRRVHARNGAHLLWIMGLPVHRLFRAPRTAYGTPPGFMFLRRSPPPARHRRDPRTGCRPISHRRVRALAFRWTHLYEHADPRLGVHPDWGSSIFNYGRNEVRGFPAEQRPVLASRYHADGLRVDAVASMLYLDYLAQAGAVAFRTSSAAGRTSRRSTFCAASTSRLQEHPDVQTIAEESTAWPLVSRPTYLGAWLRHEVGHGLDATTRWRTCPRIRPRRSTTTS